MESGAWRRTLPVGVRRVALKSVVHLGKRRTFFSAAAVRVLAEREAKRRDAPNRLMMKATRSARLIMREPEVVLGFVIVARRRTAHRGC